MAESIVEQAVGALLPFSQPTPASPSLGPTKGFVGGGSKLPTGSVEGTQARMGSTASTSMGVTLPRDPMKSEAAAEVGAMDSSRLNSNDKNHGGGGNSAPLLALDIPSPSSPRQRNNHDDAVPLGGLLQGSAAGGRGIKRERGNGVEPDSSGDAGSRVVGSRTKGRGSDEDGGYVVLLTPTLEQVSLLVAALEAPQVPTMGFVVVCPLYDWNQERDEEEIRRLREFTQVGSRTARLVKKNEHRANALT